MSGWNSSVVGGPYQWPDRLGYHLNVSKAYVTTEAAAAAINPTSPDVVWAGDTGRPATLPVFDEEGNKVGSKANPAGASPYSTVFLLFADEAEARAALPGLWVE